MLVNGRLTAPPQVEAAVVTNSVASFEPERTPRSFRAKAIDLDTFVFSANSEVPQSADRWMRAPLGRKGPSADTIYASKRLSTSVPTREAAPPS